MRGVNGPTGERKRGRVAVGSKGINAEQETRNSERGTGEAEREAAACECTDKAALSVPPFYWPL